METLFVVVYSNEGVMKSVSDKCDWKVSSSFIIKDLRFRIYELGLFGRRQMAAQRGTMFEALPQAFHFQSEERLGEHFSMYVHLLHVQGTGLIKEVKKFKVGSGNGMME